MKAFDILGFSFEADLHCVECSIARFGEAGLEADSEVTDSEGNTPKPIFACEASLEDYCGDCHEPLFG